MTSKTKSSPNASALHRTQVCLDFQHKINDAHRPDAIPKLEPLNFVKSNNLRVFVLLLMSDEICFDLNCKF